jgi:alkyldihydroxyacetonephosphate synthase
MMTTRRRSFGVRAEDGPSAGPREAIADLLARGSASTRRCAQPPARRHHLPAPRHPRRARCNHRRRARPRATYGNRFAISSRAFMAICGGDAVAFPRSGPSRGGARLVRSGGGDSLGGGSTFAAGSRRLSGDSRAISIDLATRSHRRDRALARAARIQGSIYGPALKTRCGPDLTLRHFHSRSNSRHSVAGSRRARADTMRRCTHIGGFVDHARGHTRRVLEQAAGIGRGAGPDRMFIGSEGTLGIITGPGCGCKTGEVSRLASVVRRLRTGGRCVRRVSQARLSDEPPTARRRGSAHQRRRRRQGAHADPRLQSADHALDAWASGSRVLPRPWRRRSARRQARENDDGASRGAAGAWRNSFLRAPTCRRAGAIGFVAETFQAAIWILHEFHARVTDATADALQRVCGAAARAPSRMYARRPRPYSA